MTARSTTKTHRTCTDHMRNGRFYRRFFRSRVGAKRTAAERGAAIVEAAFVTPLFFLLIMAIFEFGPMFFEWGSGKNAVSEGVRAASISGANASSDYDVVQSMRNTLKNLGPKLDYVIIYKGDNLRSSPPAACLTAAEANKTSASVLPVGVFATATSTNVETFDWGAPRVPANPITACNIYYRRMFDLPRAQWIYDRDVIMANSGNPAVASLDRYWPSPVRIDYASGPQDFIGIYVQSTYQSPSGIMRNRQIKHKGIVRIEPSRANK